MEQSSDILKAMCSFVAVPGERGFASAARFLKLSPLVVTPNIVTPEARFDCKLMHCTTQQARLVLSALMSKRTARSAG